MYDYFKNIAEKNSCNSGGVCSIHPSVNSLYNVILSEVSKISFYLVKLNSFNMKNDSIASFCTEVLSVFLINTSFNHSKYFSLILKLNETKKEIKEKYLQYCKHNNFPCEIINENFEITQNTTISELIEHSENIIATRQKSCNKEKLDLFELITLMAKSSAVNVVKIKKFIPEFNEYDYEILRFFALTTGFSLRVEKLNRRILEFSKIAFKIKYALEAALEEKYGKKETAEINFNLLKGHSILVSGDDFNELEEVLKTLEKINPKEEINVYTNGSLFSANFYPYFKNNKYLKGHWGTDNAEYDFSTFKGAILITQNFVQKIDSLYRGEIFSNKLISFAKVSDIENNDYIPLIETSLKLDNIDGDSLKIKKIEYDENKLNVSKDEIVIICGRKKETKKEDKESAIIINCPLESKILLDKVKNLKQEEKITIFFSECTLENLSMLFILIGFKIDIYFVNCSNVLINPHVVGALKENFNLKII